MKSCEIYFSTDIEADGPIPGINSMLSLGSAAYLPCGDFLGSFSINLEQMDGAVSNPSTMQWWQSQKEAWEACRKDLVSPQQAMEKFVLWVENLCQKHNGTPVFVGYPAGFDFLFVYWYMIRFLGRSPFGFSAIDMKTLSMALLKTDYRLCAKKRFPKRWFSNRKHTHIAVDDAIEQGEMFIRMLREIKGENGKPGALG